MAPGSSVTGLEPNVVGDHAALQVLVQVHGGDQPAAAPHGRAFPRVRRAHEPDARVAPHRILDDRRRAIAAPVVNDEDVGVEGEAVECGEHLAERLCDARLLVERRNDNRQKRRTHRLWKRST